MMTKRQVESLVKKANRLSNKTRFSSYYGAPAWDLSEKEIEKHYPARDACLVAAKALESIGDPRAREYTFAVQNHCDVINRRGCSF